MDASGQKSDVLAGTFASKNTKGNWGRYGLYGTLPEAFLVSGNYRIRRKQIFVSYDSMEMNFRFLLGNKFSFPGNENSFLGYCTAWPCPTTRFFQYLQATGCHRCWCSALRLSKIAGCTACAPMYHSQPCAFFGWHSLYHPEAHRLLQ